MQTKTRSNGCQQQLQHRQKTNKECFNYRKREYYVKDYHLATKRKLKDKKANKKLKKAWWIKNWVSEKAFGTWLANQDNSDSKSYLIGRTFMTRHLSNDSNSTSI